jgi:hypothetical protein
LHRRDLKREGELHRGLHAAAWLRPPTHCGGPYRRGSCHRRTARWLPFR